MRSPPIPGTVDRGHVIQLDPTFAIANKLARAAGVDRFTFNWGLAEIERRYKAGEKVKIKDLKREFNAIKRTQFPWITESPRDANSQPFADLARARKNFFDSCSGKRKGRKIGRPKFRRRGVDDSFYVSNDKFKVRQRGKRGVVCLPVIGDVRMMEPLRWQGKILSARVFRKADKWFIAINVETRVERPVHVHAHPIVGIDLGLTTAVMPSHGEPINSPRPLRANLKRLRRAQRRLSRRKKGSKNRNKQRIKVARVHQRVANVRKDWGHKTTTTNCRENQTVVIENFPVAFMLKNPRLARAASDVGIGMLRSMWAYKAPMYGTTLVVAHRHFPSTQRCQRCGNIKTGDDKLDLNEREYVCAVCGYVANRDRNAAFNLEQYPRLEGNWDREVPTSTEIVSSTQPATSLVEQADRGSGN